MESVAVPAARPALLVVDDEVDLLELFVKRLTKAGFDVSTASTGGDAIVALSQQAFHVVICDINMPGGINGFEVLEHVRKRAAQKIGFLFVTGHGEGTPELEKALSLGVDGVYSKPISSRTLIAHLRQLCGLPADPVAPAAH